MLLSKTESSEGAHNREFSCYTQRWNWEHLHASLEIRVAASFVRQRLPFPAPRFFPAKGFRNKFVVHSFACDCECAQFLSAAAVWLS